jgi:hypothetical protein
MEYSLLRAPVLLVVVLLDEVLARAVGGGAGFEVLAIAGACLARVLVARGRTIGRRRVFLFRVRCRRDLSCVLPC